MKDFFNSLLEDREVVENPTDYRLIRPQEAAALILKDSDLLLLDVRSPSEFNGSLGHLKGSVLIPIRDLEKRLAELKPHKNKTIITYCSHGIRSATAAKLLTRNGFSAVSPMGGLMKWNREHLPVVRQESD